MSVEPEAPRLRLGIAGCGGARRVYGPILRMVDTLQVVAVLDPDLTSARGWQRQLGSVQVCTEPEPFFSAELDAVLITAPALHRPELIGRALDGNRAVLCDPPFAEDMVLADVLSGLAADRLFPSFPLRYEPAFVATDDRIAEGAIGDVKHVRCDIAVGPLDEETRTSQRTWSGLVREISVHYLDRCRTWLGEAETVTADIDAPDAVTDSGSACILLQHKRGQSVVQIIRMRRRMPAEQVVVTGTAGTIHLMHTEPGARIGAASWRAVLRSNNGPPEEITPIAHARPEVHLRLYNPIYKLLSEFVSVTRDPQVPFASYKDAHAVMEMQAAALLSAPKKQRAMLPLVMSDGLRRGLEPWRTRPTVDPNAEVE